VCGDVDALGAAAHHVEALAGNLFRDVGRNRQAALGCASRAKEAYARVAMRLVGPEGEEHRRQIPARAVRKGQIAERSNQLFTTDWPQRNCRSRTRQSLAHRTERSAPDRLRRRLPPLD
jgi:hypothetical protein